VTVGTEPRPGRGEGKGEGQSSSRRHNLSAVLHHALAGSTRAELSQLTGLGRATITSLVAELLDLGLLDEQGPANLGRMGRPGSRLGPPAAGACGVGLEINVDYLSVVAIDLAGRVRYRARSERDNRTAGPARVISAGAEMLAGAVSEVGADGLVPVGLGVAVPGITDRDGLIREAPNVGWRDVRLLDHAAGSLPPGLPVTVDNEANLAAVAELHHGHGRGRRDFVVLTGEVGIGAGIVANSRLFRGAGGGAGEIGHVPVSTRGPLCGCGNRGCLERLAGQDAMLSAAGINPAVLPAEPGQPTGVALLVERAAAGDPAALAALARSGRYLGAGLRIVTTLLAPEAVIFSGIFVALAPWLLKPAAAALHRRSDAGVDLLISSLGPDAAAMGAATVGLQRVLDDPESVRRAGRLS